MKLATCNKNEQQQDGKNNCWIIDQLDEDGLEDLWRDYHTRSKRPIKVQLVTDDDGDENHTKCASETLQEIAQLENGSVEGVYYPLSYGVPVRER